MPPLNFTTHSCATCERLIVDSIHQRSSSGNGEEKNFVHFDFILADLLAAPRDCHLCAYLLQTEWIYRSSITDKLLSNRSINRSDPEAAVLLAVAEAYLRHDDLLPPPDPTRNMSYWVNEQDPDHLKNLRLACFYYSHRIKFFALWNVGSRRIEYRSREGFAVFAKIGNPAARFVSTRPIEQDLLAPATLQKVSMWLTECLEGKVRGKLIHDRCPRPVADFLPKRLVEISSSSSPSASNPEYRLRLIDTDGLPITSYVALSYCWGGDQPLKTTKSLLPLWLTAIPWDQLPNTLKDATIICAKLGFRHIWIDAFCIVQDDPDDMDVEIAKMPSVYQNSILTLAVSRAASVKEGFLQPRSITDTPHCAFQLPFQCYQPAALGTVTLLRTSSDTQPLDSRGWTLQERLLSPRTLEFGSRQTRFFCQHNPRGFTDGWTLCPENTESRSDSLQDVQVLQANFNINRDRSIKAYSLEFEEAMNNWLKLVEVYTHRHLTVPTDRIIAISGIAARYGQVFGDQYCAGLWRASCPRALFWQCSGKRQPRPRVWQGPSWSWTSIAGPVRFPIPSPMDEDISSILAFEIELANVHNAYGALLEGSGRLTVRARLNSAVLIFEDSLASEEPDVYAGIVVLHGEDERGNAKVRTFKISYDALDKTEEERSKNNVVLLELQTKCTVHRWMTRGLVCRSMSDDVFVRVGTFQYLTVQDSRRDIESDDDWYMRVDRDFNWFKGLQYDQYDII